MLYHEPEESSATLFHKRLSLWLGPCQHVAPFRQGEGRNYFDPLWDMSSFTVKIRLEFPVGEEMLVPPNCGLGLFFSFFCKNSGSSSSNKMKVLTNEGKYEEFDLTYRPQRDSSSRTTHKYDKVQRFLGRAVCSCRSECRTMGVWADFWPEQWQDDMEPDRHTQSSRIYTADRRGSFTEKEHCQKISPRLPFPLLFPTSFMCFGTSGTHDSKVNIQTLSTNLSTTLWREMSLLVRT